MTKTPDMGDIQKDLKEFFSNKYGAQVQFAQPRRRACPRTRPRKKSPFPRSAST